MNIEKVQFTIKEIANGFVDNDIEGAYAFDGKLNIRPKYQREFVYDDEKRYKVMDTIFKGLPLNVMYWVEVTNENGETTYEILDGQQRTISFCQYFKGKFSYKYKGFDRYYENLEDFDTELLDKINNYEIDVYICKGSDDERLDWFRTINIAGKPLNDQELLNANYTGQWLTDAKNIFSKPRGFVPSNKDYTDYLTGKAKEQDYLATALKWISNGNAKDYMAKHQNDTDANELWLYFNAVIAWVKVIFPHYRKEMKSVQWGELYNKYKDNQYNAEELEAEINRLMADDDVTAKKGVYEYLLSGKTNERVLSIRAFTDTQKRTAYERQQGICPICGEHYEFSEMEGDHIIPWSKGGKTTTDNLQMLCRKCNGDKSNH